MKGKGKGEVELRFQVGSRVQCRTGPGNGEDAWSCGTVVRLWYREEGWPASRVAPYQIKLDDSRLIFAPMDDDRVIRALSGILADGKIPVTVLTGFLGAGKTTLLNYILKTHHGKRYAVIENEIGAVGVDNQLLENAMKTKTEEQITLLDNGCLCCTVRGDLVDAIQGIVNAARKREAEDPDCKALDGILIETTGMADPGPICKTFYGDPFACTYCKIDGVITVVDCVHFIDQLTRERSEGSVNESAQQVAFADKVLLNKVDAATPEKLKATLEAVRGVNDFVPITQCSLGKKPDAVPLTELLSIDAFDLTKMLEAGDIDLSLCGEVQEAVKPEGHGHGGGHGHEEGHGDGHGDGHGGGHGDCAPDCAEEHGHGGGHGGGGHGGGHGHGHGHSDKFRHDSGVGSFVCEIVGKAIDEAKFRDWMSDLLGNSENLYRYKGICAMRSHHTGKVMTRVIQGVHDMCDMDEGDEWPKDRPVKSQLVLIGRNLERKKWSEAFVACGEE
mmetsp:Transcript_99167/g.214037  ORF Transcript_99167/g.214037 Transcript_99167/m.214037 type:complete len:502 (+) Transcript_99167:82-1587(+)